MMTFNITFLYHSFYIKFQTTPLFRFYFLYQCPCLNLSTSQLFLLALLVFIARLTQTRFTCEPGNMILKILYIKLCGVSVCENRSLLIEEWCVIAQPTVDGTTWSRETVYIPESYLSMSQAVLANKEKCSVVSALNSCLNSYPERFPERITTKQYNVA